MNLWIRKGNSRDFEVDGCEKVAWGGVIYIFSVSRDFAFKEVGVFLINCSSKMDLGYLISDRERIV